MLRYSIQQQLVEPHIQPKSWRRPCRSYIREEGMGRSSLEGHCSRSRGSATPRLWCDHHHIQERVWKPPKHHRGDQGKRRAQWRHPRDITARTSPASPCFKKCSEQLCQTRSILKKPTSSSDTYIHTGCKRRNRVGTQSIMRQCSYHQEEIGHCIAHINRSATMHNTSTHLHLVYFGIQDIQHSQHLGQSNVQTCLQQEPMELKHKQHMNKQRKKQKDDLVWWLRWTRVSSWSAQASSYTKSNRKMLKHVE